MRAYRIASTWAAFRAAGAAWRSASGPRGRVDSTRTARLEPVFAAADSAMRSKRSDASCCLGFCLEGMDVLIVERDELIAATLAGALADEGIDAGVATDDEALALTHAASPHVVITGMNRTHHEDLAAQDVVRTLRRKWPAK